MLDNRFIDRSAELAALRERLASDRAEFMVVYGKRRVGKTALVLAAFNERRELKRRRAPEVADETFRGLKSGSPNSRDGSGSSSGTGRAGNSGNSSGSGGSTDFLYLVADRRAEADQLREFSRRVVAHFDPALAGGVAGGRGGGGGGADEGRMGLGIGAGSGRGGRGSGGAGEGRAYSGAGSGGKEGREGREGWPGFTFESWGALFEYLAVRTAQRRTVVVIDEFPYLCLANRALASILQKAWDQHLAHSRVYLVLLGSSLAMMESEVLGYKAPLYGRRTGQLLLEPFSFGQARRFFPGLSLEKQIEFFAVAGGMPAYLRQLDPALSLRENLASWVLAKGAFLNEEVEFVLKEELREPRIYMSLLKELAAGGTKVGELASALGMDRSGVSPYLANLERLRLARRELPVTERRPHRSRRGLWRLTEPFFRFYFRFMAPHQAELEQGLVREVLDAIEAGWPSFVAEVFEQVCTEAVWALARQGGLPFTPNRVGRWWFKGEEIDVVARDAKLDWALYGECKWQSRKVGPAVLEGLEAKAERVKWEREPGGSCYLLFSKAGFTEACRQTAAEANEAGQKVLLMGLEELDGLLSNPG